MSDTPIMIRKENPEEVHCESYDWPPQWVYIHNMQLGMFAKMAANALLSVLGATLHAELVDTVKHLQCLHACLQADPDFAYPTKISFIIEEDGKETTTGKLQVTYESKALRCTHCQKFGHRTSSCPINHSQSTLP